MKTFLLLTFLGGVPFIAWLPARLWTLCGDPWCLEVFPDWLDHLIYWMAQHYLSHEMTIAAEQMDFIEVWMSSIIIIYLFASAIYLPFRDKFRDDP